MSAARIPVIITRAEPGASETALWLEAEGFMPIVSPAIVLRAINPAPELSYAGLQGLIFTSANGVRFYSELEGRRDMTAWCVGEVTAHTARAAGFETICCAAGDAAALAAHIAARADAEAGGFLHIANAAAGDRLVRHLQSSGFETGFAALYESVPASSLSDEAVELLRSDQECIVLIQSAKGGEAFNTLARTCDLSGAILVSISQQAARPLEFAGFGQMIIASAPDRDAVSHALRQGRAAL